MKNSALLMVLVGLLFLQPQVILASDHHWPNKLKEFFQSLLPTNLKYCTSYDGNLYLAGDIFKNKNCGKWDKEISLGSGGQGQAGPQGEPGVAGKDGLNGTNGLNGISGWEKVSSPSASTTEQLKTVTVTCPSNKKVLSGGFVANSSTITLYTIANYPSSDNSWTASVHRSSTTTPWDLTVYAICASIP